MQGEEPPGGHSANNEPCLSLWDGLDESASVAGAGSVQSGDDREGLDDGEITIIEKRRRVLECFCDMMANSIKDMQAYFGRLDDFMTLSDNDKLQLFHASMLEILLLKCYWTYKDGAFVHPETKEPMVTKELLILGTADVNFVETFMGLFHKMETIGFGEQEICLLICISMFETGRTDIGQLDDREGIISRQNRYIQQLVKQVNDSNVAEALMMRTTLKDLKNMYMGILSRTEQNSGVDMTQPVYDFIRRVRNPELRAPSSFTNEEHMGE